MHYSGGHQKTDDDKHRSPSGNHHIFWNSFYFGHLVILFLELVLNIYRCNSVLGCGDEMLTFLPLGSLNTIDKANELFIPTEIEFQSFQLLSLGHGEACWVQSLHIE